MDVTIRIPIRTQSEANMREHWAPKANRAKVQRQTVEWHVRAKAPPPDGPLDIYLTRIAPRALDGDNLQTSFKAIRDGIAKALGLRDDREGKHVDWFYSQERGQPKEYAVLVRIVSRVAA